MSVTTLFVFLETISFVLADLPVYKRKLIEMPDTTKLQAYGMPENPDTVAKFTFINNGTEQFQIETEGAHLKQVSFILSQSKADFTQFRHRLELFILLGTLQIISVTGWKKSKLFSLVIPFWVKEQPSSKIYLITRILCS